MSENQNQKAILNVRVLDQDVVEELSGKLGSLIEQASSSVSTLDSLVIKADETRDGASNATTTLQQRLQLGARLLVAIDEEAGTIEPMLSELKSRASEFEQADIKLTGQFQRFQTTVSGAVEEISTQRFTAEQTFERIEHQIESLQIRLTVAVADFEKHTSESESSKSELQEKLTDFKAQVTIALGDLEVRRQSADLAAGNLDEKLQCLQSKIDTAAYGLDERRQGIDSKLAFLESRFSEIQRDVETDRKTLETQQLAAKSATSEFDAKLQDIGQVVADSVTTLQEHTTLAQVTNQALNKSRENFQGDFSAAVAYLENRKREIDDATTELQRKYEEFTSMMQQSMMSLEQARTPAPDVGQDAASIAASDPSIELGEIQSRLNRIETELRGEIDLLHEQMDQKAPPSSKKILDLIETYHDLQLEVEMWREALDDQTQAVLDRAAEKFSALLNEAGGRGAQFNDLFANARNDDQSSLLTEQTGKMIARLSVQIEATRALLLDKSQEANEKRKMLTVQVAECHAQMGALISKAEGSQKEHQQAIEHLEEGLKAVRQEIKRGGESLHSGSEECISIASADGSEFNEITRRVGVLEERSEKLADNLQSDIEQVTTSITRMEISTHDAEEAVQRIQAQLSNLHVQLESTSDATPPEAAAAEENVSLTAANDPGSLPDSDPNNEDDPAKIPDTPQGGHVRAFLNAINATNAHVVEVFIGEHYSREALEEVPLELRVSTFDTLKVRTGGVEVVRIVEKGPEQLVLITRARADGNFYNYQFRFDPAEPFGILSIQIDSVNASEIGD